MSVGRLALPAVAAAVLVVSLVLLVGGGSDGYRLRLVTDDAAGLRKDFSVKIAGAPVGKVTAVELDGSDRAVAELEIDASDGPVGRDARAAIRASNLLGEKYVDLRPGNVLDPAPDGFTIRSGRVTVATELDDVLAVLRPDTRVALAAFLAGQGDALAGRGGDLAEALRRLPPTLEDAGRLVDGLAADNRAVGRLIERSDRIVARLAGEREELARLVTTADAALGPLAERRDELAATVREAPATLEQVRRTLQRLRSAAGPLSPAARGLHDTAAPLRDTLAELPGFADAARPTLRTAAAVAPDLARLGREAGPVVRRLRPAAAQLQRTAQAAAPVTEMLDEGSADLLGMMQGWARAIQNRDGTGHVFRVGVELGQDVLNMLDRALGAAPRRAERRPRRERSAPATPRPQTPAAPAPRPEPLLPVPRLPKLPSIEVPGLPPIDLGRGVDRLAEQTERLLDFLLRP